MCKGASSSAARGSAEARGWRRVAANEKPVSDAALVWAADAAYRLLAAVTTDEVNVILNEYPEFAVAENWHNYGGVPKNWDRVGAQTSEPVGALAEVIINSVDAILMRKAREAGINKINRVRLFFFDFADGRRMRGANAGE